MCEDFLIKYKEDSFTDRFLNKVVGKVKRAEINKEVARAMEHIFRDTEYTVDLLVHSDSYSELKDILDDLPFSRVVCYNKISQIQSRLLLGDLTYVVDENTERVSELNNPTHVLNLQQLRELIGR